MFELALIAGLGWLCLRYRTVGIIVYTSIFIIAALSFMILLKIGFVGPFFMAIISIPVDFFTGLFGIIYHL